MPLFRWDSDFDRWRDDMMRAWSRMTQDFGRGFDSEPDHYLVDTGDKLVLEVELPGVQPDQVDLEVDAEGITVRGEWPQAPAGLETVRRQGEFTMYVNLPAEIDPEHAEAHFHHGLLRVDLPKTVGPRRRLPISVTSDGATEKRPPLKA
jgi:HSP20 family protein